MGLSVMQSTCLQTSPQNCGKLPLQCFVWHPKLVGLTFLPCPMFPILWFFFREYLSQKSCDRQTLDWTCLLFSPGHFHTNHLGPGSGKPISEKAVSYSVMPHRDRPSLRQEPSLDLIRCDGGYTVLWNRPSSSVQTLHQGLWPWDKVASLSVGSRSLEPEISPKTILRVIPAGHKYGKIMKATIVNHVCYIEETKVLSVPCMKIMVCHLQSLKQYLKIWKTKM